MKEVPRRTSLATLGAPRPILEGGDHFHCTVEPSPGIWFRESETTIKIKFACFRGGWAGGQRGKLFKTLFFVGNATTIKF